MGGHIAPKTRKGKEKPGSARFRAKRPNQTASTVTTPGTALMAPAIWGETL
jgi:hypothetical protein